MEACDARGAVVATMRGDLKGQSGAGEADDVVECGSERAPRAIACGEEDGSVAEAPPRATERRRVGKPGGERRAHGVGPAHTGQRSIRCPMSQNIHS